MNGYPAADNAYLYNGDFVDRGSFSAEVIMALFCWKLAYPERFFITNLERSIKLIVYGPPYETIKTMILMAFFTADHNNTKIEL